MSEHDNKTLWCGNLAEQITEELLHELFLQAGPLEKVRIPKDRDGRQRNFAFVTYCHEVSVPYAINLFRGTALFHRTLLLQPRGTNTTLQPPIRCYGPEKAIEFPSQSNVAKPFVEMTESFKEDEFRSVLSSGQSSDTPDNLALASLQGNWQHRHHPYRPKEKSHRDDPYRPKEKSHRDDPFRPNEKSHRDDPYRPKEKSHRDDYRQRDSREARDFHNDHYKGNNWYKHSYSNNWRDRRHHQKGSYH